MLIFAKNGVTIKWIKIQLKKGIRGILLLEDTDVSPNKYSLFNQNKRIRKGNEHEKEIFSDLDDHGHGTRHGAYDSYGRRDCGRSGGLCF